MIAQPNRTHSEWHESYGHLPLHSFAMILKAPVHLRNSTYQCQACIEVNRTPPPFPVQGPIRRQTTRVGELVHGDLCGPMPTEAIGGHKYILALVDDYSRFTMAKAIHERSDAAAALSEMVQYFERMTGINIGSLQVDLKGERIIHPSESVARYANRWIISMIRTTLHNRPKDLWPYAMEHGVYTKNRLPHPLLGGKAPFEVATYAVQNINIKAERARLRSFAQKIWVHAYTDGKFADTATQANITGYTSTHGVYKVILPDRSITGGKSPVLWRGQQDPSIEIEIVPTVTVKQQVPIPPPRAQTPPAAEVEIKSLGTPPQQQQSRAHTPPAQSPIQRAASPSTPASEPESPSAAQLQFEYRYPRAPSPPPPPQLRRTTRSTAGKPPTRLADDPAYTGIKPAPPPLAEANVAVTEVLASTEACKWPAGTQQNSKFDQLEQHVYEQVIRKISRWILQAGIMDIQGD